MDPNQTDDRNGPEPLHKIVESIWREQVHQHANQKLKSAEDYLEKFPQLSQQRSAVVDVIYNEFVVRSRDGNEEVDPTEFVDRFPEYADELQRQFRLHRGIQMGTEPAESGEVDSLENGRSRLPNDDRCNEWIERQRDSSKSIGRFRLGDEVGRGSYSIVYQAWDPQLDRAVAIKMPRSELIEIPKVRKRFLQEAKAVTLLHHPNIVPIHEIAESAEYVFIVSELIDGPSFDERMDKPVSRDEAIAFVIEVGEALHYAHQNGVIHRDVKPGNILIRKDGRPLLTDFGLARLLDSTDALTRTGEVVGTPAYMSPEQARGDHRNIDARTDIYSLGVILYQLLTGRLPFTGSFSSTMQQLSQDAPKPLRAIDSSIDRDLETMTLKCLNKDREDRYTTANEFVADLQRFQVGEPIKARSISIPERLVKYARRRPKTAALAMLLLVLIGFVSGGALQLVNVTHQRDRARQAENAKQSLLAHASMDAGNLAMQRGHMVQAAQQFEQALAQGYENPIEAHLRLVECTLASDQLERAKVNLERAIQLDPTDQSGAEVSYWRAELALDGVDEFGDPISAMNQIPVQDLDAAKQHYVAGLLSRNSLEAVDHFQQSISADPFHHRARRMSLIMQLSLARFDRVLSDVGTALQMYPENIDFRLIKALALAATDRLAESTQTIGQSGLSDLENKGWLSLCKTIHFVTQKIDNESELGQINVSKIADLLDQFERDFRTLLENRRWHFPPAIGESFAKLSDIVHEFDGEDIPGHRRESLELAKIHPEGSLLTLAARMCVAGGARNIEDLEAARDLFEKALQFPAFVRDAHEHAEKGIMATALQLALIKKHEVEKNNQIFARFADRVDPVSLDNPRHLRTITIALLHAHQWSTAKKWSLAWVESEKKSNPREIQALWHLAIIHEHDKSWLKVLEVCEIILKRNPDFQEAKELISLAKLSIREKIKDD